MKMLRKLSQLVFIGLRYDSKVIGYFLFSYLKPSDSITLETFSDHEIKKSIEDGQSIIRFGDGEMLLMTGRDIYFQETCAALNKGLRTIIENYSEDSPYILGVPTNKLGASTQTLKEAGTLKVWRLYRVFFKHRFDATLPYCTATYFYIKEAFEKNVMPHIKDRHIIWVSKKENYDEALTGYFDNRAKAITYIETPSTNAFTEYDTIKADVLRAVEASNLRPILLLAAGPATKVLAYELSQMGIQCLDIGQGITVIAHETDRSDRA